MSSWRIAQAAGVGVLLVCAPRTAAAQGNEPPQINERFPIGRHLSPPIVGAVSACATHVYVSGFIPHATVRVYKNGTTLLATATPTFGFTTVTVPPLVFGDRLTATQTVFGTTSAPTNPPTVVGKAPVSLAAPTVDPVIYACGRIVPVRGLVSGVTVSVRDVDSARTIGSGFTPNDWGSNWSPAFTTPLVQGHHITATQASCAPVVSPPSAAVSVLPEPSPLLAPTLDPPVVGNDAVTAHGLYVGARLEVFDGTTPLGSGYATGANNWQALGTRVTATSHIVARQSLCHHSPPSVSIPPVSTLAAPVVLGPICPKAHMATIRGTTINANVVLFQNGAIIGYGGAGPGDVTLAFAPPAVAADGDVITALQYIGSVVSPLSNAVHVNCSRQNVTTQHNDNARRGAQLAETVLTPTNVAGRFFGLLYDRAVSGTILAQPLYVHGVKIAALGGRIPAGVKNVVFVATSADIVYAFDADDTSPDVVSGGESTKALWRTVIGTPHVGDICAETDPPVVGITSTPVIDVSAGRMYVVARDQHGAHGMGVDVLHALDITTGADLKSVVVGGSATVGGSTVTFHPACQRQRPGLLLQDGNVYLGYGTYSCDSYCPGNEPYRGWVLGFRASDFAPAGAFTNSLAPAEGGMGIWASGNGLAGNGSAIFYETGNDIGSPGVFSNGDAFVKLTSTGNTLTFAARFRPGNAADLKVGDTDLGSGGPMLLPGGKLVGGGKEGVFYVLPQSNLTTGATSFQAFFNSFHWGPSPYPYNAPPVYPTECPLDVAVGHVGNRDQHCWIATPLYPKGESYGPNIHGGPVYWATDATHGFVYKMAEKDYLKAFAYNASTGTLNPTPAAVAPIRPGRDGMPGGFSSVSAAGRANGIVWTVVQQLDGQWGPATPAILYAFDARTLRVLWSNAGQNQAAFAKFNSPTIADGRVFLPSVGHFQVYGLARQPLMHTPLSGLSLTDAIRHRWFNGGAEAGTLGAPLGQLDRPERDPGDGAHVDFAQDIPGGGYGNISLPADVPIVVPMCSDAETQRRTRIVSSIYASPRTGAWIVRGEIRRVFLAQGGVRRFGYPLTDESPTPNGVGLMSRFERGTLVWYPGKEVAVQDGRR